MITGTLLLPNGARATIDGNWQSDEPLLQDYLRQRFPVANSSRGIRGSGALVAAAKKLKGTARVNTSTVPRGGTVVNQRGWVTVVNCGGVGGQPGPCPQGGGGGEGQGGGYVAGGGQTGAQASRGRVAGIVGSIGQGIKAGFAKVLDGLDAATGGAGSMIAHGLATRSPAAIAQGVGRVVALSYNNIHDEVFEHGISKAGGSAMVGKIGAAVAAKAHEAAAPVVKAGAGLAAQGVKAVGGAIGRAFGMGGGAKQPRLLGNRLSRLLANADAVTFDQMTPLDQQLIDVGVQQTLDGLTQIYQEYGIQKPLPDPQVLRDKMAAKIAAEPAQPPINEPQNQLQVTPTGNVFCPTGKGGGIKPDCPKGTSKREYQVTKEKATPPPPGPAFRPNVTTDRNGDGVTDAARVGVPAMSVPPLPPIGRLPNLTHHERAVERAFAKAYEKDPDGMATDFRTRIVPLPNITKPGDPPTFGTDDAKLLSPSWENTNLEKRSQNRATLNLALHQTANAIAKRAFLQHLDTLKEGDEVLITAGFCGAGKGYAVKNIPEAVSLKKQCKAVWDSAGDQNSTEHPWIQKELEARGLKGNYLYVHADPKNAWANPKMGVVQRAANPEDGRMVSAHVFADSVVLGARNHKNFAEANASNPNAKFIYLENKGTPKLLDGMPKEALSFNRKELAQWASGVVKSGDAPAHVKRGATIGDRVWGTEF